MVRGWHVTGLMLKRRFSLSFPNSCVRAHRYRSMVRFFMFLRRALTATRFMGPKARQPLSGRPPCLPHGQRRSTLVCCLVATNCRVRDGIVATHFPPRRPRPSQIQRSSAQKTRHLVPAARENCIECGPAPCRKPPPPPMLLVSYFQKSVLAQPHFRVGLR